MKRKSDKLMILNTRNFVGPGKNSDDPLMILEEEEPKRLVGVTTKRMKGLNPQCSIYSPLKIVNFNH